MGESSVIALKGSRVSSGKLAVAGFHFEFPDLGSALKDTLK
jgi:NAD dependent epimerase/dehydratase family enzyme